MLISCSIFDNSSNGVRHGHGVADGSDSALSQRNSNAEDPGFVACELPILSYVGGSRILHVREANCRGKILWRFEALPEGTARDKYIRCVISPGSTPVLMKAWPCAISRGAIVGS